MSSPASIADQLRQHRFADIHAELHLAFPSANGEAGRRMVLSLRAGRAVVQPGGYGRIQLADSAMRDLLAGRATVDRLADAGRIDGPADELRILARALAG